MLEFIPAKELKQKYSVLGYFYTAQLADSETLPCRSDLEIFDKAKTLDGKSSPDAIFIMMNPGSSRPVTEMEEFIPTKDIANLNISLVPTKPDTTQYQVMRVMNYCNWGHVRVINLSDLRDGRSGSFENRFSELEKRTGYTAHSAFSSERIAELERKLVRKSTAPIVCAWGVSDGLNPLIARCMERLGNINTTGLRKEGASDKYYHPLPTLQTDKLAWVDDMVRLLNA